MKNSKENQHIIYVELQLLGLVDDNTNKGKDTNRGQKSKVLTISCHPRVPRVVAQVANVARARHHYQLQIINNNQYLKNYAENQKNHSSPTPT
jgi:hypothetical protein